MPAQRSKRIARGNLQRTYPTYPLQDSRRVVVPSHQYRIKALPMNQSGPTYAMESGVLGKQVRCSRASLEMVKRAPATASGWELYFPVLTALIMAVRVTSNNAELFNILRHFPLWSIGRKVANRMGICSLYATFKVYDTSDLVKPRDIFSCYVLDALQAGYKADISASSALVAAEAEGEPAHLVSQLRELHNNNRDTMEVLELDELEAVLLDIVPDEHWIGKLLCGSVLQASAVATQSCMTGC